MSNITQVKKDLSDLDLAYFALYSQIAKTDIQSSLQTKRILNDSARRDLKLIGAVKEKKVLEVGPGLGDLSELLRSNGAYVTVADLVPDYLMQLRTRGFDCYQVDAQNLSFFESFDLIVLCDVLEHVFRPYDVLHSSYLALKKSGLIYVRSPNRESLKNYSPLLGYPYEIVHLRTYNADLLKRELYSSGFKVQRVFRNLLTANRQIRNVPFLIRFILGSTLSQNLFFSYNKTLRQRILNFIAGSDIDMNKSNTRRVLKPLIIGFRLIFMSSGEIAIIAKK